MPVSSLYCVPLRVLAFTMKRVGMKDVYFIARANIAFTAVVNRLPSCFFESSKAQLPAAFLWHSLQQLQPDVHSCAPLSVQHETVNLPGTGSMALRSGLAKWSTAWKLAAGLTAGSATYALCEDIRGPSFDPEALERGAKALREINASPYAKKVKSDQCRSVSTRNLLWQMYAGCFAWHHVGSFTFSRLTPRRPVSAARRWWSCLCANAGH